MQYYKSENIEVTNGDDFSSVYHMLDDFIAKVSLGKRNAIRLRLLTEEVIRLAKSIVEEDAVSLWLEGNSRVAYINLKAVNNLDANQREKFRSMATNEDGSSVGGFFNRLLSMFIANPPTEKMWTLKDYQEELLKKKESDKYSQEAWDDLERSLVANLADDIEVSIKTGNVIMKVTKDFSEALSTIGSRVPEISSEFMLINSSEMDTNKLSERANELIEDLEVSSKDERHLKLLFEETIGMLGAMVGDYHVAIRFERYKREACIKLTAKTLIDSDKKSKLLDVSKEHQNALSKGFMGKVGDIIESGINNYNNIMSLQQQYGLDVIDYGSMGLYSSTGSISDAGLMWSLYDYKNALQDASDEKDGAKEAWDELEKSIVANVAKDVLVGVKGNRVDMTIVCDLC